MKARKWILAQHFEGVPKDSDLELHEESLPDLNDGDVLFEALYLSVDPYMRVYTSHMPTGITMIGQQLAKVTSSKHKDYAVGSHYMVACGWRDKTILNMNGKNVNHKGNPMIRPAMDTGTFPKSLNLGIVGMPGLSAYFGLMKICDPNPGETVFVNSAAGIVGSVAGQIAKIAGCRVVACAGTDEKCDWLKSELGFDYVFNYKTNSLSEQLKLGAPNGIDCYFDNVGGDMSITVIQQHMNKYGRITCCGAISAYNSVVPATGPHLFKTMVVKELKMQGFLCSSFLSEIPQALQQLNTWLQQGKLKYRESIVEGFENMRTGFYGMLSGNYIGKVVIKV